MPQGGAQSDVALRLSGISKTFPGMVALNDVTFDVPKGGIHALVGGNGSGKSTLIKVLAGVYRADSGGEVGLGTSEPIAADSMTPSSARAHGLRFVHQSPAIFPRLSIADNLAMGHGFPLSRLGWVRRGELRRRSETLLERFHVDAKPTTLAGALRPADQTLVAIARALQDQDDETSSILVLDEPTTVLPEQEVELLLGALRRYAAAGQTIIYVSHRIDEVLSIADSATVLRDGRHIITRDTAGLTETELITYIAGRELEQVFTKAASAPSTADPVCEIRHLAAGPLRDVTLSVTPGEVVGIAGLLGSGRSELLQSLFGAHDRDSGEILFEGQPVALGNPADAIKLGIAYIPEDRAAQAAFLGMSVRENLSAAQVSRYWRHLRFDRGREGHDARDSMDRYLIRAASDAQSLSLISGGNQQKVVLARWLRRSPKLLLLDEPTQGIDVGARAEVYRMIIEAVRGGAAAMLVSSDFDELVGISDRVLVLRDGVVAAELVGSDINRDRVTHLAYMEPVLS